MFWGIIQTRQCWVHIAPNLGACSMHVGHRMKTTVRQTWYRGGAERIIAGAGWTQARPMRLSCHGGDTESGRYSGQFPERIKNMITSHPISCATCEQSRLTASNDPTKYEFRGLTNYSSCIHSKSPRSEKGYTISVYINERFLLCSIKQACFLWPPLD